MTDTATQTTEAEDFSMGAESLGNPMGAIPEAVVAKGAKLVQAGQERRRKEHDVKAHLLGAMVESLDDCPHGDKGRQYGETTISRLERDWAIDARTGDKLEGKELADLKAALGRKKAPASAVKH